jgi:arylsulfatase
MCFAAVVGLLAAALSALIGIDAWAKFDTPLEIWREIAARILIALALSVVVGSGATITIAPYVLARSSSVERYRNIRNHAALITAVVCSIGIVGCAIRWFQAISLLDVSATRSIFLWDLCTVVVVLGFIIWYFATPDRHKALERLSDALSGKVTRRFVLGAGLGAFLVRLNHGSRVVAAPPTARSDERKRSRPNFILVTFDALAAEDMSCYGYRLPTTPNIDALAQSSSVFRNYYAASTFTTPCVASMMTGRYPSNTGVYQYSAPLHGSAAVRTLPQLLRSAGYRTAASVGNPGAHPACLGFGSAFDILPAPPITDWASVAAVKWFDSATLADDLARAQRFPSYMLEQIAPRSLGQHHSAYQPKWSFQQALRIIEELPEPYFLWVHTFAPHFPYLPERPYFRRFLNEDDLRTHFEFSKLLDRPGNTYSAARQPDIDKLRLRYNEWTAQADGAFGTFVQRLESAGHLANTTLIVSADHGECFEGGFFGHGGQDQFRPIIHIPLIIHQPQQRERVDVVTVIDQTALAPTILELAAIPIPEWVDGVSVSAALTEPGHELARSRAFAEFFINDSTFHPLSTGSIGVIQGDYQYLWDLAERKGGLFKLADTAHGTDLASAEAQIAGNLHALVKARFESIRPIRERISA